MFLTQALLASTSGIEAQHKRISIIAQNIANVHTRASTKGEHPYQRQVLEMHTVHDRNMDVDMVEVGKINKDQRPFNKIYSPNDIVADKDGFVEEPNIDPLVEISDMREASRSQESNIRAFERVISMMQNLFNVMKI